MEENASSAYELSEKEFLYIFKTILDIGTIRSHIQKDTVLVDLKDEDFEEMRDFVNVYIHLLAHNLASDNHKDIFSIGISSMEGNYVRKIVRGLEDKLRNDYSRLNRGGKVNRLVSLINFAKDVDSSSIDEYIDLIEITSVIRRVKYNVDIEYLKKELEKEIV